MDKYIAMIRIIISYGVPYLGQIQLAVIGMNMQQNMKIPPNIVCQNFIEVCMNNGSLGNRHKKSGDLSRSATAPTATPVQPGRIEKF
jgi:hypothetical protein